MRNAVLRVCLQDVILSVSKGDGPTEERSIAFPRAMPKLAEDTGETDEFPGPSVDFGGQCTLCLTFANCFPNSHFLLFIGTFPPRAMTIDMYYVGIFLAAVASFMFGFLVHGPVFGKQWMALMKITPKQMEEGKKKMEGKMQYYMGAAFVQQLVTAAITAHVLYALYVVDVWGALVFSLCVWLAYVATTLFGTVLWEGRSKELYAFNVAYHLANIAIISVIVTIVQ